MQRALTQILAIAAVLTVSPLAAAPQFLDITTSVLNDKEVIMEGELEGAVSVGISRYRGGASLRGPGQG
ncbi:MAG: hypothetical protein GY856_09730 [bacterium]|nr:hypothetical protein [bacterium]